MNQFRQRKSWVVLLAVLLLFAACKGETPTAPPPGGGVPPDTTTPPSGVTLTLTASNTNPLVDSTVTITASALLNGNPVPNGTAVEFVSNGGTLEGGTTAVIRTTTNGAATVTLTSSTATTIRVSATVNNVTRTIDITFRSSPVIPPLPNTTPTITSVSPNTGRPAGGEVIRINGTNFKTPVRVLFRIAGRTNPVEATVNAVSDTAIEVVTPGVDLGAGQQLVADIIVITQAGSATEQRVESAGAFTFRNIQLTPVISTVTPNSGPVTGGTRVSIIGEGFQHPVQVLFGTAEARVLNVTYGEITVETPAGRDTSANGSDLVTGPVPVSVRNIASNQETSMASGFLYKAAITITGVTVQGNSDGTSRLTIEGIGFVPPLIAVVRTNQGDVSLSQISVSGTKIIGIAPRIIPRTCGTDVEGPIIVTNIVNGDQATGPIFTFPRFDPKIINVSPTTVTIGVNSTITVVVLNPIPGVARFRIGTKTVFPTAAVDNGDNTVTFTVPVPTNLDFPSVACGTGGTRFTQDDFDVTYVAPNDTSCDDTVTEALTVIPPDTSCVLPPGPPVASVSPAGTPGSCAQFTPNAGGNPGDPIVAAGGAAGTATITFTNTAAAGSGSLTISGATVSGTNGTFGVSPTGAGPIAPGNNAQFQVTVDPTAAGPITGTVTFTTDDPNRPTISVCLTGNGS